MFAKEANHNTDTLQMAQENEKLDDGWPESEEKYSKICNCEDRIAWNIEKIYEDVSKKEDVNV